MLSENLKNFLENQKKDLVAVDEAEKTWANGMVGPTRDSAGRAVPVSMGEALYNNTINWLNSPDAARALSDELSILNPLSEDTLSTAAPVLTTQLLPLVRRLYNNLIALDLVSTQPITGPSAYIYYLDKTYTSTAAGATAGQRTDQGTTRQYAGSSEQGTIRELQMQLTRKLIEASTDKLKADWTLEAEQDFQSQYKLSVEAEMLPELGDEIARELDRKILDALVAGVGNTINWNPAGYLAGDTNSVTRRAYRRGIYDSVVDARAWITANKRTMNAEWWLVMTPATWARFAKLEDYGIDAVIVDQKAGLDHKYEGVLQGIYKVYVVPDFSDCYILMGVKKDWKYACGYYAPYIPLFPSSKYIINDDFTQLARGVMSRYDFGVIPEVSTGSTNNGLCLINICQS